MEHKKLILPVSVISPTDVARLTREVENLDEFFRQSAIREGGTPQTLPRYSRLLDEVVATNQLNLLGAEDRELLIKSFYQLQESAPVMHISFSADPPGTYIQKIVGWLRQNIDGLILVRVGLMPNIGAGCVVRTTNKTFDFSLRSFFDSKQEYFRDRLHKVVAPELEEEPEVEAPVTTETTNQQIGENPGLESETEVPEQLPVAKAAAPAPVEPHTEVASQPSEEAAASTLQQPEQSTDDSEVRNQEAAS